VTLKPEAYKTYLIVLLTVILAFNGVDRLALGLVLQNIKIDLGLSDTQLGFLSGIAFGLFYAVMGVPIARWADRSNRIAIIAITIALWSAGVAACGLATNFSQLLLIRIGVAVGEAGCIPPAHSLIADYFTRGERPRAVSVYMLGAPLSAIVGYFGAGWLNELLGWRATFMWIGLPGLALAALAWLTLKEPRRKVGATSQSAGPPRTSSSESLGQQPNFLDVCSVLWRNVSFRHLLFCFAIVFFFGYGILLWQPTFFVRSFGIGTGQLGTYYAVICGPAGVIGTYLGGEWATRRAANDEGRQLKMAARLYCLTGVSSACIYLSPNIYVAFFLLGFTALGNAAATGPLFGTIQTLVPEAMRATSIAIIYLFANLVGMGLGPLAAGLLSDGFKTQFGAESLRYALLALSPGYLWGAWHLWRSSKTVRRDITATEALQAALDSRLMAAETHL
jgi:MFS family permease